MAKVHHAGYGRRQTMVRMSTRSLRYIMSSNEFILNMHEGKFKEYLSGRWVSPSSIRDHTMPEYWDDIVLPAIEQLDRLGLIEIKIEFDVKYIDGRRKTADLSGSFAKLLDALSELAEAWSVVKDELIAAFTKIAEVFIEWGVHFSGIENTFEVKLQGRSAGKTAEILARYPDFNIVEGGWMTPTSPPPLNTDDMGGYLVPKHFADHILRRINQMDTVAHPANPAIEAMDLMIDTIVDDVFPMDFNGREVNVEVSQSFNGAKMLTVLATEPNPFDPNDEVAFEFTMKKSEYIKLYIDHHTEKLMEMAKICEDAEKERRHIEAKETLRQALREAHDALVAKTVTRVTITGRLNESPYSPFNNTWGQ